MQGRKIVPIILALLALVLVFVVVRAYRGTDDVDNGVTPTTTPQNGGTVTTTPTPTTTPSNGDNGNNDNAAQGMIRVTAPTANQTITSPVTLRGEARGNWYFEASFPVRIVDDNGKVLAERPVQADGEWMTTNFVAFEESITFDRPSTSTGVIIFMKDNPSGLQENYAEYRVPVRFGNVQTPTTLTMKTYFSNSSLLENGQDDCATVFPVERTVQYTTGTARAAIQELLKGPTTAERARGYTTSLNTNVEIKSLTIENGVARIDFNNRLQESVGGSCRVAGIRAQITETLKQFPSVRSVEISVDGRTEDILQP